MGTYKIFELLLAGWLSGFGSAIILGLILHTKGKTPDVKG